MWPWACQFCFLAASPLGCGGPPPGRLREQRGSEHTQATQTQTTRAPMKGDTQKLSPLGKMDCRPSAITFYCLFFFPVLGQPHAILHSIILAISSEAPGLAPLILHRPRFEISSLWKQPGPVSSACFCQWWVVSSQGLFTASFLFKLICLASSIHSFAKLSTWGASLL